MTTSYADLGTPEHAAQITKDRHQGVKDALQWLAFSHLPERLRDFARPIYQTAVELIYAIKADSPELITALNQLIPAKDLAVRAGIRSDTGRTVPQFFLRELTVVNPPVFDVQAQESFTERPIADVRSQDQDMPDHPVPNFLRPRPTRDEPQA